MAKYLSAEKNNFFSFDIFNRLGEEKFLDLKFTELNIFPAAKPNQIKSIHFELNGWELKTDLKKATSSSLTLRH